MRTMLCLSLLCLSPDAYPAPGTREVRQVPSALDLGDLEVSGMRSLCPSEQQLSDRAGPNRGADLDKP